MPIGGTHINHDSFQKDHDLYCALHISDALRASAWPACVLRACASRASA